MPPIVVKWYLKVHLQHLYRSVPVGKEKCIALLWMLFNNAADVFQVKVASETCAQSSEEERAWKQQLMLFNTQYLHWSSKYRNSSPTAKATQVNRLLWLACKSFKILVLTCY